MFDFSQVEQSGDRFRIIAPITAKQLSMIHEFLAPAPEGRGFFDNFVLNNTTNHAYRTIAENGQTDKYITDSLLFDLWYLLTTILPEVCGCNRDWILFTQDTLKSPAPIDPNSIEITKPIFDQMTQQLIAVIRGLNKDIPIISDGVRLMQNGPCLVQ